MSSIMLMALAYFPLSPKSSFRWYLCSGPIILTMFLALWTLYRYHPNDIFNFTLLILYTVSYSATYVAEKMLISIFSFLIPRSYQASGQAVRNVAKRLGNVLSIAVSGVLYLYLDVVLPISMAIVSILFVGFIVRRESFSNPKPIF